MSVNGRAYDWEDITVTLPHGEAAGITEIKYEDGQEITARYGRGSIPRSYGRGNYEASGSMVLDRDEWEKLKKELTGDGAQGDDNASPMTCEFTILSPILYNGVPAKKDWSGYTL